MYLYLKKYRVALIYDPYVKPLFNLRVMNNCEIIDTFREKIGAVWVLIWLI